MTKRKKITKKKRFEVFKRDEFTCQYCGATPPSAILQVDHIHPVKLGGDNHMDNLITSCQQCNLGKSATPLTSIPESLSERAAKVKEREQQIAEYGKVMAAKRARIEAEAWEVAASLEDRERVESYSSDKMRSIEMFLAHLPLHEVIHAADTATSVTDIGSESQFKYFCGVCWRKIKAATNEI
jgi:hypothetical protein